jgi:hypothetical protein
VLWVSGDLFDIAAGIVTATSATKINRIEQWPTLINRHCQCRMPAAFGESISYSSATLDIVV